MAHQEEPVTPVGGGLTCFSYAVRGRHFRRTFRPGDVAEGATEARRDTGVARARRMAVTAMLTMLATTLGGLFSMGAAAGAASDHPPGTIVLRDGVTAGVPVSAAGRVVWREYNADFTAATTWSAHISSGGAAPAENIPGPTALTSEVLVDGRRTAVLTATGTQIDGGPDPRRPEWFQPIMFSGHRLAAQGSSIQDLTLGPAALDPSIGEPTGTGILAIWGDRAILSDVTWGSAPTTPPTENISLATLPYDQRGQRTRLSNLTSGKVTRVAVHGDVVAWTWSAGGITGRQWRNVATGKSGTLPIQMPNQGSFLHELDVFGNVVAYQGHTGVELLDTRSGAMSQTGVVTQFFDFGPPGLVWNSGDADPVRRRVLLLPFRDQHLPPRHEGNPLGATHVDVSAATPWRGEWVFSESLTTCAVDVLSPSGGVVRQLPCDVAIARQGEAVVDWNGRDVAGDAVPSDWYTLKVVAADADGAAVHTDGVSTSVSSLVHVTGSDPAAAAYRPLTPARLLDTRSGEGAPAGRVTAG